MTTTKSTDDRVLALAEFIEKNANQPLSLEDLAKKAALSPFHFQRKFTQHFGISPKQFQNAMRIQHLKQSLRDGKDITSAIYDAGFGSSSRVYEQIDQSLGMTPSAYKSGGKTEHISFALRNTRLGQLIMAATERGVCFVHFGDSRSNLLQALHREFPSAELTPTPEAMYGELDLWIDALEMHFNGECKLPKIPLDLYGTTFQLKVWRFLTKVKKGHRLSYKEVAQGIDQPSAYRAVANACGANKIAVLIPCHRVLRGDGEIGGYRWGVERKRQLLESEAKPQQRAV